MRPKYFFGTKCRNRSINTDGWISTLAWYLIKFVYHTSGDRPLVITKVMVSCNCASPVWPKEPLQLGVRYTSSGYFDPHNKTVKAASCIFVFSNAGEKPEIIRIEAIISHKWKIYSRYNFKFSPTLPSFTRLLVTPDFDLLNL